MLFHTNCKHLPQDIWNKTSMSVYFIHLNIMNHLKESFGENGTTGLLLSHITLSRCAGSSYGSGKILKLNYRKRGSTPSEVELLIRPQTNTIFTESRMFNPCRLRKIARHGLPAIIMFACDSCDFTAPY